MFEIMKVHLRLLRFNIIFRPFICIIGTLSHLYFLMSLKTQTFGQRANNLGYNI